MMEWFNKTRLFEYRGMMVDSEQVTNLAAIIIFLLIVGWFLLNRILPWYYSRETTSEKNRTRTRRGVVLAIISLILISALQILNIDLTIIETIIQSWKETEEYDFPPRILSIHISHVVKAMLALGGASLFNFLAQEFLTQRLHLQKLRNPKAAGSSKRFQNAEENFRAVRPLLYGVAIVFILHDIGVGRVILHIFSGTGGVNLLPRVITVEDVGWAIIALMAIRVALTLFITLILNGYYNRRKLDRGQQYAINRLLNYFVYVFGVLLVLQIAGFDLVVLWTGAAALLVGIGIGLQQTFNDLICGIIILFERSVKVGDVVELQGHQVGTVRKIGARTSTVETRDDIIVFVPNSKLIGENVTNWSQVEKKARFHVAVGVAYGSDTKLVREILLDVAKEHPHALDFPKPVVRFLDFGDSALLFDLIFFSRNFVGIEDVKSDIRFAIDDAFRARGVEIPFPQRDVWIRSTGPAPQEEE
ncbi:mechanosensitive ion channel family protein [Lewinella sp. W8]|uniref:mechanosensitive ion channel family protein n=1 Tax=Lewinella sp. W8 TaxID=2528208 RepID=UPI001C12B7C3|nr:mechanosensitive ion channel domain-containing protein [Lewinella sp. W8]